MPRNINNEVEAESRESALDIIKSINTFLHKNVGKPESCLLPPGTIIAAANIMVTIRVPTTSYIYHTKPHKDYNLRYTKPHLPSSGGDRNFLKGAS